QLRRRRGAREGAGQDPPDRDPAHLCDRITARHRGAQRRAAGARPEAAPGEPHDPRARAARSRGEGSEGTPMNGQQGMPLVNLEGGPAQVAGLVVGLIFLAAAVVAIIRIVRGPSILDRMIATDALLATIM